MIGTEQGGIFGECIVNGTVVFIHSRDVIPGRCIRELLLNGRGREHQGGNVFYIFHGLRNLCRGNGQTACQGVRQKLIVSSGVNLISGKCA